MEKYIGTKVVLAFPMSRATYNEYRGWQLPLDENGADKGYLVEYLDGGKPNHEDHIGYISWSPEEQFKNAYVRTEGMNFGMAIEAMRQGHTVSRQGWNGKGMFIYLVPGSNFTVNRAPLLGIYPEGTEINYRPHIDMKDADGYCVPWLASQTDMLALDWGIVS